MASEILSSSPSAASWRARFQALRMASAYFSMRVPAGVSWMSLRARVNSGAPSVSSSRRMRALTADWVR
jgi:hypothetical protein